MTEVEAEKVSAAMDCIGWLSIHGYTMTFCEEGLMIEPEDLPEFMQERLSFLGSALHFIFPNHASEVGRILGGKTSGSDC